LRRSSATLKKWRRGFEHHSAHSLRGSHSKRTPVRLADEDTALSRWRGGFDSLTGDSHEEAYMTGATGGAGGLQNPDSRVRILPVMLDWVRSGMGDLKVAGVVV